jgi:hypothetical protein
VSKAAFIKVLPKGVVHEDFAKFRRSLTELARVPYWRLQEMLGNVHQKLAWYLLQATISGSEAIDSITHGGIPAAATLRRVLCRDGAAAAFCTSGDPNSGPAFAPDALASGGKGVRRFTSHAPQKID